MSKYSRESQQAWAAYWVDLQKHSALNMPASVHFGAGFKAGSDLCETLSNLTVQAEIEYEKIRDQRDELLAALKQVMPYVVTQQVACNGLRCRESVCMSCNHDSLENSLKSSDAYCFAEAAIAKAEK